MKDTADLSHGLRAAPRAAEGFRACSRVLGLMIAILPDTDEINALVETRDRLATDFNALVMLDPAILSDAVRKLEFEVAKMERELEALDRAIPMNWFRDHFDASQASSVALVDYATLLGRYVGDSPLRLDRIQLILTRVVSFFLQPEDDTPTRRRELLAESLPRVDLDEPRRQAAVAFLRDAARRVTGFARLNDVIKSGFFVDVRGYKLSLRAALLDPDVMTAAIELNEAVNDNMRRLAEADAPAGKELEAHLAEVDQHLKSIFKQVREDESATQDKFERWLAKNAQKRAANKADKKDKKGQEYPADTGKKKPKFDRRPLMAVILVVVVIIAAARWRSPGGNLAELSSADLKALSPVLVQGTVAPAKNPRIFVGQVDKSRWALMSLEDRGKEADRLSRKLAGKGWFSATVLLEEQVVIQIEEGQILIVQ